jgi:hypothetical protein
LSEPLRAIIFDPGQVSSFSQDAACKRLIGLNEIKMKITPLRSGSSNRCGHCLPARPAAAAHVHLQRMKKAVASAIALLHHRLHSCGLPCIVGGASGPKPLALSVADNIQGY